FVSYISSQYSLAVTVGHCKRVDCTAWSINAADVPTNTDTTMPLDVIVPFGPNTGAAVITPATLAVPVIALPSV
ncbi:TPA: hypothetical protein ACGTTP_004481, partial [Vibrio parahaemolyticus]